MAHTDDFETQRSNLAYIKTAMTTDLLGKEEELELAKDCYVCELNPWFYSSVVTEV